jgi:uncharacterized protein YeaO (DUF488 family)
MTLQIHTARLSYTGPDRLDITRKSADSEIGLLLAPSRQLLCKYHPGWGGRWNWPAYREDYLYELGHRYEERRDAFDALLLDRSEVTLVCYCRDARFCHRVLAALFLEEKGAVYLGERTAGQGSLPGVG